MSVPLRVLGDRVLVRPDLNENAPEVLASGVVLAPTLASAVMGTDPTTSVHRGTVVAVGAPKHPKAGDVRTLADRLDPCDDVECGRADCEAARLLLDLVRREPCVALEADVLFAHDAGQQVTLDGETYVILHEHELLAVVEN